MTEVFNTVRHKEIRRQLREDSPPAEQKLWAHIRRRQIGGHRFRRQYGIGPFVVDFYCPEARLVIEVAGPSHYEPGEPERDRCRQEYLEKHGLRVLRFTNTEVLEETDRVVEAIWKALEEADR
ncbi:MAG: endonuclease domain-containing protein [Thermoanaerobaculia bacterium]|nr:endonuclease domain-containing protein [Thermoanaerobaculia bacterium]